MEKTGRIENPDVKEYIYRLTLEKLGRNLTFAKVFGSNFVKKRIKNSISVVYTNEPMSIKKYAGYHNGSEKSITLCNVKNSETLLTVEELEGDLDSQETALHEAIHAILNFNAKECKKHKIVSGTGLLKRTTSPNFTIVEIGRGLNEGYTEWLCEKCGYKSKAYPELTDLVRLIETAIGTENTMELGKGNFQDRFQNILSMTEGEVYSLLACSDNIYKVREDLIVVEELESYLNKLINVPEDFVLDAQSEGLIKKYRKDPLFLLYIKENGKDASSNETLLDYLKDVEEVCVKQRKQSGIIMAESSLINRYFINDLQEAFSEETISKETFLKISKIVSLLNTDVNNVPVHFQCMTPEMSSITIKKEYDKYLERYIEQVTKEGAEKYKNGELNIVDFIKSFSDIGSEKWKNRYFIFHREEYFKKFADNVDPEFSDDLTMILDTVYRHSDTGEYLEHLTDASILKLVSKDSNKKLTSTLVFDKENYINRLGSDCSIIRTPEEEVKFDFTSDIEVDDEYAIAMKNFDELRKNVFRKNPDAKINITSREIIVQDGDDLSFYTIEKGELIPMEVVRQLELNFNIGDRDHTQEENSTESLAVVPRKDNIWTRVTSRFKQIFSTSRNENPASPEKPPVNYHGAKENKIDTYLVEDFDKKLEENKSNHEEGNTVNLEENDRDGK